MYIHVFFYRTWSSIQKSRLIASKISPGNQGRGLFFCMMFFLQITFLILTAFDELGKIKNEPSPNLTREIFAYGE